MQTTVWACLNFLREIIREKPSSTPKNTDQVAAYRDPRDGRIATLEQELNLIKQTLQEKEVELAAIRTSTPFPSLTLGYLIVLSTYLFPLLILFGNLVAEIPPPTVHPPTEDTSRHPYRHPTTQCRLGYHYEIWVIVFYAAELEERTPHPQSRHPRRVVATVYIPIRRLLKQP